VVKTFGVCDFSRLAVTDWRLRRWRLWFLALMTATPALVCVGFSVDKRHQTISIHVFKLNVPVESFVKV